MMSKLETIILYVLLQLLVPGLAGEVVFLVDPSSYSLSCNPYGSTIQLPCTIQEPQDLNSSYLLSVLWFWFEKDKDDQITNACHVSSHYRCNMLVGHDRYNFVSAREAVEISREDELSPIMVFNRMFDFQISNVSAMDTGCYQYLVWLNDEQLNETSGVFCLEEESEYQDLPPCDRGTSTDTAPITIATTESPACTLIEANSLMSGDNSIDYVTAFYVTMVVCAVLMITTCTLAIVVAYFTVGRLKGVSYNNSVKGCSAVMDTYRKSAERQLESHDSVAKTVAPTTQPLGIYCLAEKDDSSANSKGIYESKIIPPNPVLMRAQYNKTPSLSLCSPGSHIYQTLDKDFFEELAMTKESEDHVFDDTNYSALRNSQISSISSSVPTLLQRNSTSNVEGAIYDKLKPKQLDLEYSYAYLPISGHKEAKPEANNELLHIAEMGYEMDPIIVSTLMREKKQQADAEATSYDGASIHGYQSLDHAKLTPRNSYTSTVVRKE